MPAAKAEKNTDTEAKKKPDAAAQAFDPTKLAGVATVELSINAESSKETAQKPDAVDKGSEAKKPEVDAEETAPLAEIVIRIPIGPRGLFVHRGYAAWKPEVALTRKQAAAAKFGACVVSDAGGRCPGGGKRTISDEGSTVENQTDFIRFLLEAFANELEKELGANLQTDFSLIFR